MSDRSNDVLRSFKTVVEMLRDRAAYDPVWRSELVLQFGDEYLREQSLLSNFVLALENDIRIVYMMQSKFRVPDVRRLITNGKLAADHNVIFITIDEPTPANLKTLRGMFSRVQMFMLDKLRYNLMHNKYQPRFDVLSEEEAIRMVIAPLNLKSKSDLPKILNTDPVAQYLALKPGQIVKITRKSPSAGEAVAYRVCV